jgi:vitamin B12 transporter
MHKLTAFLFGILLFLPFAGISQGISLPELEVKGGKTTFVHTLNEQQADTGILRLLTSRSLADLLEQETGMALRSYGAGGSALLSLRGSSSAQTTISWNGLTLNSPMLGVCDLSLIPSFLAGEVCIQYGGQGSSAGNGAIGGSILIDEAPVDTAGNRIEILGIMGSFGEEQLGISLESSKGKMGVRSRIYGSKAKNNFEYNRPGGERIAQSHADFTQYGFTHSMYYDSGPNRLMVNLWHLETARELPPHMLADESLQEQFDQNSKASASWTRTLKQGYFRMRAGVSSDRLRYKDPMVQLDDKSNSLQVQGDAESSWRLSKHTGLGLQGTWNRSSAKTDQYGVQQIQDWYSIAGKFRWNASGISAVAGLRQAWANGKAVPFLPSLECRIELGKGTSLHMEGSRVFRLPTLNDRYWLPGGNPDLLPENGYATSIGMAVSRSNDHWTIGLRGALFASDITNAIVWIPNDQAIYSAVNMHRIVCSGAELDLRIQWRKNDWQLAIRAQPSLTRAEVTATEERFSYLLNRQLMYTPQVMYRLQTAVSYRQISLRVAHRYTGYRYTTEDHAHFLDPFDLTEAHLSWNVPVHKAQVVTLNLSVTNLFNEAYQVVAWRAMPGRAWQIGMYYPLSW